jgi:hypothetical protein
VKLNLLKFAGHFLKKDEAGLGTNYAEASRVIRRIPGYQNVTGCMLSRWEKRFHIPPPNKTRGKPVSGEFEAEVVAECIFTECRNNDQQGRRA